jgi:hypothetical protein
MLLLPEGISIYLYGSITVSLSLSLSLSPSHTHRNDSIVINVGNICHALMHKVLITCAQFGFQRHTHTHTVVEVEMGPNVVMNLLSMAAITSKHESFTDRKTMARTKAREEGRRVHII